MDELTVGDKFKILLESIRSLTSYGGGDPILLYEFTSKVDIIMPNIRSFSPADQGLFIQYILDKITGDAKKTLSRKGLLNTWPEIKAELNRVHGERRSEQELTDTIRFARLKTDIEEFYTRLSNLLCRLNNKYLYQGNLTNEISGGNNTMVLNAFTYSLPPFVKALVIALQPRNIDEAFGIIQKNRYQNFGANGCEYRPNGNSNHNNNQNNFSRKYNNRNNTNQNYNNYNNKQNNFSQNYNNRNNANQNHNNYGNNQNNANQNNGNNSNRNYNFDDQNPNQNYSGHFNQNSNGQNNYNDNRRNLSQKPNGQNFGQNNYNRNGFNRGPNGQNYNNNGSGTNRTGTHLTRSVPMDISLNDTNNENPQNSGNWDLNNCSTSPNWVNNQNLPNFHDQASNNYPI